MKILITSTFLLLLLTGFKQDGENKSTNKNKDNHYHGPVIDMHIHAYDSIHGATMFGMDYTNPLTGESFKAVKNAEQQRTQTFEMFSKLNIVKALVSDGELWYADDADRIMISGRNASTDELRLRHQNGMLHAIGEMVHFYGGLTAADPSLQEYFHLAEELDIPVSYHVFPGGPPGGIYYMGMKDVRVANANPLQVEEVLVQHPNIKFILAHAGWPYLEDLKALMYAHPQLYVELGVISWIIPRAEFHHYLESLVRAGFGKRIMFGTDQMVWPETIETAYNNLQSADFLSLEQKADIFYNNAAKILSLSKETIERHKKP